MVSTHMSECRLASVVLSGIANRLGNRSRGLVGRSLGLSPV
jgi:hypothetical protein